MAEYTLSINILIRLSKLKNMYKVWVSKTDNIKQHIDFY